MKEIILRCSCGFETNSLAALRNRAAGISKEDILKFTKILSMKNNFDKGGTLRILTVTLSNREILREGYFVDCLK